MSRVDGEGFMSRVTHFPNFFLIKKMEIKNKENEI